MLFRNERVYYLIVVSVKLTCLLYLSKVIQSSGIGDVLSYMLIQDSMFQSLPRKEIKNFVVISYLIGA